MIHQEAIRIRRPLRSVAATLALFALGCLIATVGRADSVTKKQFPALAIKNVKIVVKPGEVIENGSIVMRDGVFVAVGSGVEIPYDAEVIDGEGLTAYAGFIDASTQVGIPNGDADDRRSGSGDDVDIDTTRGALSATRQVNRKGIFPDYSAARHIQIGEKDAEKWRKGGFTAIHSSPGGALLGGTSALVLLSNTEDSARRSSIVRHDLALIAGWRTPGRSYPSSLMGSIAHLRQTLLDARHYADSQEIYERTGGESRRPPYDAAMEALQPALSGEMPTVFPASSADEIRRALSFAREFNLTPIIDGGQFAFKTLETLKEAGVPLLLRIDFPDEPEQGSRNAERLREFAARSGREVTRQMERAARKADRENRIPEPKRAFDDRTKRWEERVANAKALWEAEIPFALTTKGQSDGAKFHENLRRLIEAGLPADAALHALTVAPARILGVESQLGSLEEGKIANVTLIKGELGGEESEVFDVIVDGKRYNVAEDEDDEDEEDEDGDNGSDEESETKGEGRSGDREIAQSGRSERGDRSSRSADSSDEKAQDEASTEADDLPVETDDDRIPRTQTGGDVLIRNATILTISQGTLENADVLVRDGIIVEIGRNLRGSRGVTVIDGTGSWVMPGIIDCHSHMAITGGVNEGTLSITAQVRIEDVVRGDDLTLYRAAAGGVTTANLLHGSANTIGGQRAIIQMKYNRPAEEIFFEDYPPGIKFALGENVTRSRTRFPNTRMGVEAVIRRAFNEAQLYQKTWDDYAELSRRQRSRTVAPRRDLRLEALAGVLDGSILVHSHSYNADEITMLLSVLTEFGVRHLTLEHALEAYKVAPEVADFGDVGAFVSTFADNWAYKIEAYDAIPYNVALINEARPGAAIINSDSGERVRRLYLDAAKMVRFGGLTYDEALRTITLNPARALQIDDRVGSIEIGKNADLALFNGHPLNVYSRCFMTLIDGEVVFERRGERGGPYPLEPKRPRAPGPDFAQLSRDAILDTQGRYAITNATIHPVSSPMISEGTIVIEQGLITAIGRDVSIPRNAIVIDARGLEVYPGMIDGGSTLGLNEIGGSLTVTQDASESGVIQPDLRAAVAVKPDSELIPVARFTGITSAVSNPTGGLIPGQSAMIQLDGWTPAELAYVDRLALEINVPTGASSLDIRSLFGPAQGEQASRPPSAKVRIKRIKDLFDEAREYARMKNEAERRGERFWHYEPDLEALIPYVNKDKPVVLRASAAADILEAIDLAQDLDVWAILRGVSEGWKVAPQLAASGIPVILSPVMAMPSDSYDPYDSQFTNPARLYEAGVEFCFQSRSGADSRNLPFQAGMAAAFGLPRDVALRSVTLAPAEIFGIADQVGSLEVGKRADIIVVDRDPLQATANVRFMFINGKPVDVDDNKHTRLYKKYRQRIQPSSEAKFATR